MHSDAAQSLGKVAVNVQHLGVDLLTVVGHKYGCPKVSPSPPLCVDP